jgi:hypothetical protein
MPEPPAVVVLELHDGRDLELALQILGVVRLPDHRLHVAVADSARRVLAVFASRPAEVP